VTLTGVGGVGKTRLALQTASTMRPRFKGPIWLVDFASLVDDRLVAQTVASRLGLSEQAGHPLDETLSGLLMTRRALLVLDNCEHLVDACAELAERLLRACPRLTILVTSRESFTIPGERVYQVPPLTLPTPEVAARLTAGDAATNGLERSEAIALFLDRATAANPAFRLAERNASAVLRVCQYLEGLPLAIELAAARTRSFSVDQIAMRLEERFWPLTGGSRTVLPRHRTLQASVDWSYDLLSEPEQVLLHRLSPFMGGFTLEAAERVGSGQLEEEGRDGHGHCLSPSTGCLPAVGILELLAQLVGKSLVLQEEHDGQPRYRLLETIRQYAAEKLALTTEEETIRDHHASFYLELAERAAVQMFGPEQVAWLERLELEYGNLRAALDWIRRVLERGEAGRDMAQAALRFGAALGWFWTTRGRLSEGRDHLMTLLALASPTVRTTARVDALFYASTYHLMLGDLQPIRGLLDEALALSDEFGYARGTALALMTLGLVAQIQGEIDRGRAMLDEGLTIARRAEDSATTSHILVWRANLARAEGRLDQAADMLQDSLGLARERGDRWWAAHALVNLAHVVLLRGDPSHSAMLAQEGLRIRRELNDCLGISWCIEVIAWAASARGHAGHAARLLGAAQAARERVGLRIVPHEQLSHERAVAATRDALGVQAFETIWAEGHSWPTDHALDYAHAADEPATEPPNVQDRSRSGRVPGALTPREEEVAALIARGYTNRQIAGELVVARGTVANHVAHILDKLGFQSRAQIAGWAVERHLGGHVTRA
jgi:non-specific serine/threonine protein kinase